MLFGLLRPRTPWQWRLGSSSAATPDQLAAACAALRRHGRKAAAERAAVVAHLAAAANPAAPGSAAAVQHMARCANLMDALADALHPSSLPSQEMIEVGRCRHQYIPLLHFAAPTESHARVDLTSFMKRYPLVFQAASALLTHMASASPLGAAAVGSSASVQALAALLRQPSSVVVPDAKLKILECLRNFASFRGVRQAVGLEAAVPELQSWLACSCHLRA